MENGSTNINDEDGKWDRTREKKDEDFHLRD
jgi:hypothetical protein